MMFDFTDCALCPRKCHADRTKYTGYCMSGDKMRVARAALHYFEEPPVSGKKGSGAIFFTGCSLRCVFCQNSSILSTESSGCEVTPERLREICFELKNSGAHNINLVTPTHFAPLIAQALAPIKKELEIPIICNSGGYESSETLEYFNGLIDIYMPDYKYALSASAKTLSHAADYPEIVLKAIRQMIGQVGKPVLGDDGIMKKGVIVRHLIIPGERKNSLEVIRQLSENFESDEFLLSLMSQYTPQNGSEGKLKRRVTTFEYESVRNYAVECGFEGFSQDLSSAGESYTPNFDLTGVFKIGNT